VGLEDYGGDRQPTNAELVAEAVAVAHKAGRAVVAGPEARTALGLPAA
jgi:3-keto-5-aminohexanoate cleavage enzyme